MRHFLSVCLLFLISNFTFANCGTNSCDTVYVEKLYITAAGTVYIGTSGTETSLACVAESGIYLTLALNTPGADAIYSALLTAQTANKKVFIRVDEAVAGCKVLYMTLDKQ